MNDSDEQKTMAEDKAWMQWATFVFLLGLLAAVVFIALVFATIASRFTSPWMSVPALFLVSLMITGAVLPVVFMLRRKQKTGRFLPTKAEGTRRFEERLNKLATGEPSHSRAWYLITPAVTLVVLLCIAIPTIDLMYGSGFEQTSPSQRIFLWILLVIVFVVPAILMYKPIMRGLRPGSYRVSEEKINRIRARMRMSEPQWQRILVANMMSLNTGIFTSQLIEDHIRNRPSNALWWCGAAFAWIVAALMIWHVFRPIRPWFSLPEPVEESEPKPNKTFKRFALGIVLPLALASIFPLFPVYDAIHPVATLYPASAQARADLSAALKTASQSHKRILLDFGANWCSDCRTINRYLQDAKNQPIVDSNFIHVRVNIYAGETSNGANANQDLADQYKISLDKSLPALAVLSDRGELIYGQKNGEFEDMHHLNSSDLTEFLLHWKP